MDGRRKLIKILEQFNDLRGFSEVSMKVRKNMTTLSEVATAIIEVSDTIESWAQSYDSARQVEAGAINELKDRIVKIIMGFAPATNGAHITRPKKVSTPCFSQGVGGSERSKVDENGGNEREDN